MIISSKKRPQVGTVGLYALSLSFSNAFSYKIWDPFSFSKKFKKKIIPFSFQIKIPEIETFKK